MNKLTNDLKAIVSINKMIGELQTVITDNLSEDERYDVLDNMQAVLESGVIPDKSADNYTIYREVVSAEFNELQILLSDNFVNYTPLTREDVLSCLPKLYKARQALFICISQHGLSSKAFQYKFNGTAPTKLLEENVKQSIVAAGLQIDTFFNWFIDSISEGAEYSQTLIPDRTDETVDMQLIYDACENNDVKFMIRTLYDELDLIKLSDLLSISVRDVWEARI